MVDDEILSEEEAPAEERYESITPPPKKSPTKKIVIVLIAFIAVIVVMLIVVMAFMQPGIVGKWHITKMEYSIFTSNVDEYFQFYVNGTGWVKINGEQENFHWKFVGENEVNLTFDSGGYSVIKYKISGDSITMKYLNDFNQEVTLYRKRA